MTVKDMITELLEMPMDAEVYIYEEDYSNEEVEEVSFEPIEFMSDQVILRRYED